MSENEYGPIGAPGDPIILGTGEFRQDVVDLEVPSLGFPFSFRRVYRSRLNYNGPLGKRWDFNYNTHLNLIVSGSSVTTVYLYDGMGRSDAFTNATGVAGDPYYPTDKSRFEKLLNVSNSAPTTITRVVASPRLNYYYENSASAPQDFRLVKIANEFNHEMTLGYNGTGQLTTITDTEGDAYALAYNSNGYLESVTDSQGRSITYTYNGPTGDLIEVEQNCGGSTCTTKYTYTGNSLLETITSPEQFALGTSGSPNTTNTYTNGRVTKQISGAGEYEFVYPSTGISPVTFYDRNDNQRVYHLDGSGRTTSIVVHDGTDTFVTEYTYHTDGQIYQIKHPVTPGTTLRRIEQFTYDTSSDPIAKSRLTERRMIPATTTDGEQDLVWTFSSYDSTFNIPLYTVDPNGLETSITITGTSPAYTFKTKVGPSTGTQTETEAIYDSKGRLQTMKKMVEAGLSPTYDETTFYYVSATSGLVSSITAQVGGVPKLLQSFTYDGNRNLHTRTDSRGKTTTLNHNGRNNLTSIVHPGGTYTTTLTYDNDDRVKTRTVPVTASVSRVETIKKRDLLGNIEEVEIDISDPGDPTDTRVAITKTEYDDGERVTKVTDPDNRVVEYVWNDRDLIKEIRFAPSTGVATTVYYTYDHEGRLTTFKDGRGKDWTTEYDGHGRVLKQVDADGNYLWYNYGDGTASTLDGTVIKETKFFASNGTTVHRHTKHVFDDLLRIQKRESMAKLSPTGGNLGDGWQTTTYEFDLVGRTTKVLDDRGTHVEFTYDGLGRLTLREHETGNKVAFDYVDQTGLVKTRTLTEVLPGSSTTTTDQSYLYDDLGRQVLHTDEANNVTSILYNFAGQVLIYKDALGNLVNHSYDRRGAKLQTVVQEANLTTVQSVSFGYSAAGLLTKATDAADKETNYTYDDRGRLIERKYVPDGSKYVWKHDGDGNITSLTDPRGTVFTYDYNNRGLLITLTLNTLMASNVYGDVDPVIYEYNAIGEMTKVTDGDSVVELTHTTLGQLRSEKQIISALAKAHNWGRTVTSTYDDAGRRTKLTYPVNGGAGTTTFVLDYDYDDLYRLTGVKRTFGGVSSLALATYTYAGFDRLTQADYTQNSTRMKITHDARRLVTDVLHEDASSNKIFEINRILDPAGRTIWRRQQYFNFGATAYYSDVARYFYDASSRMHCALHGVTNPAWSGTLDKDDVPSVFASKKIFTFTPVDTRDEVQSIYVGTGSYLENYSDHATSGTHDYVSATIDGLAHTMTNDLSGNRTEHDIGTTNATYGYDAFGRLVFAETDVAGGSVTTVTWRHDGLGRTIEEKVVGGSTKITRYYHDGNSRVMAVDVANPTNYNVETIVRRYVYGAEGPAPFFGRKEGTSTIEAYFHADERGSVLGLTEADSSPVLLEHYRYEAAAHGVIEPRNYGEFRIYEGASTTLRTASTGATVFGNPFHWTGSPISHGLYNASAARTLFVHHGAAYDPVTGTGLQRGEPGATFSGGGHTVPTAAPADWGAGASGAGDRTLRWSPSDPPRNFGPTTFDIQPTQRRMMPYLVDLFAILHGWKTWYTKPGGIQFARTKKPILVGKMLSTDYNEGIRTGEIKDNVIEFDIPIGWNIDDSKVQKLVAGIALVGFVLGVSNPLFNTLSVLLSMGNFKIKNLGTSLGGKPIAGNADVDQVPGVSPGDVIELDEWAFTRIDVAALAGILVHEASHVTDAHWKNVGNKNKKDYQYWHRSANKGTRFEGDWKKLSRDARKAFHEREANADQANFFYRLSRRMSKWGDRARVSGLPIGTRKRITDYMNKRLGVAELFDKMFKGETKGMELDTLTPWR